MRLGWNSRLEELLHRADPAAGVLVEAQATAGEDVRRLAEHWQARNDIVGVSQLLESGGVTIAGEPTYLLSNTTDDGTRVTSLSEPLPAEGGWDVAVIEWTDGPATVLDYVSAKLVAQREAAEPKTVATWRLRVFRVTAAYGTRVDAQQAFELVEIARRELPALGGTTPIVVEFALGGVAVGDQPELPQGETGPNAYTSTITVLAVEGRRSDGTAAANVGWMVNDAVAAQTEPAGTFGIRVLTPDLDGRYVPAPTPTSAPVLSIYSRSFEAVTTGFTLDGTDPAFPTSNVIELPAAADGYKPVLVATGETPGGSSLAFEVSLDGVEYESFSDGDLIGEDVFAGAAAPTALYLRVTLTPSANGQVAPTCRELGARVAERVLLEGIASFSPGGWSFDPIEMRAEISEATITLARTGERDFTDPATELLSRYYLVDLAFFVWVGSRSIPRAEWMLLDVYLVDDYANAGESIILTCLSVLCAVRQELPVHDVDTSTRPDLVYSGSSLGEVYADLLDAQVALPARWRGAGVPEDAVWVVSKTITERERSNAKAELDAIARIAGGVMLASQGQIKFVPVVYEQEPVARFPSAEIRAVGNSPGIRQRVPEFFAPAQWSPAEERYLYEARSTHPQGILRYNNYTLDAPRVLDDVVARWIDNPDLADQVAGATTRLHGLGLPQLSFIAEYAHPHLEPGDPIEVEMEHFVAKDPVLGTALAGMMWARGVITRISDALGTEITMHVRDWFVPEEVAVTAAIAAVEVLPECGREAWVVWERIAPTELVHVFDWTKPSPLPEGEEPWPTEANHPDPVSLAIGVDVYVATVPASGEDCYIQLEPVLADGTPGPIWRIKIPGVA
ncbi:MAG TPA: hypothetical protein VF615_25535 [Longimicrobiaceae bacterium]